MGSEDAELQAYYPHRDLATDTFGLRRALLGFSHATSPSRMESVGLWWKSCL